MLKNLLKRGTEEVAEATALGVVIAAPPNIFQPFLSLGAAPDHQLSILATTRDAADLIEDIRAYRPQLVLLSPEVRGYSPEVVSQLANWPEFPIAVVGLVPPTGNWGAEMTAGGATAFYTTPVTPAIVGQFDRQARTLFDQAREQWNAPVAAAGVPRQVVEAVGTTGYAYRTGVIAFWSTKGGDGKTTLAVNVACLLSQVAGKKVLLVDADMNCGRAALHLNMQPDQNTLLHLASDYASEAQLTGKMLRRRVVGADRHLDSRTRVVESRLDVLFGITKIQQASTPELHGQQGQHFMGDLLRLARELYDFVIVDLGSSTQMGPHFGVLNAADVVIFICTSDRTSLFHNRSTLQALVSEADLRPDKFKLVINRFDPADRIDLKDAADFMGMPIFATVPEDHSRAVIAAINEGRPFVLQHMGKNKPETEATLNGLLAITEEIFPPMGAIIKARSGQNGHKGRFSFGRRGNAR
ncbi:MAG: AAA family ATPase [Anaerolineales bacterium]|nr:AAA family ATPase [Anaerolineales bacterium]